MFDVYRLTISVPIRVYRLALILGYGEVVALRRTFSPTGHSALTIRLYLNTLRVRIPTFLHIHIKGQ